tara:strand:- start:669 stop:1268 length:600 start_codon:yes stop_codon:yes gene_type:complete
MKELYQALQNFQKQCPSLARSKEGYNYQYTPLEEMLSVIQPVLHQNGLLLIQPPTSTCDGVSIILTRLIHVDSGQEITSELPIFLPEDMGNKPMFTWGGSLTYGRRYAIKMLLGIEPDMDTNTEEVEVIEKKNKPAAKTEPPQREGGEALAKQFIAYIKNNPTKIPEVKKRLEDNCQQGKLNETQKDQIMEVILEVEDK